jgi:hypothetical protein
LRCTGRGARNRASFPDEVTSPDHGAFSNRVSASRLQHISQILQVPVPFFFDRTPGQSGATVEIADSDSYVSDFLATSDGLALVKAFNRWAQN